MTLAVERKKMNTIGQSDDIAPWAVTEIRDEVRLQYHTYSRITPNWSRN
jgi:hypothetical protein